LHDLGAVRLRPSRRAAPWFGHRTDTASPFALGTFRETNTHVFVIKGIRDK
jgi:hypothetical protein